MSTIPLPGGKAAACAALALVLAVAWPGVPARGQAAPPPATAGVLPARASVPQPRVRADALARVLGASITADAEVLRRDGRALTIFAGASEAVLAAGDAQETILSAPARREGDAWWLPLDAGSPLGLVREDEGHVRGPDGRLWRLDVRAPAPGPTSARAEVAVVAPGVRAARLYAPGPDGRRDGLALWAADLSLAALVVPEARAELDAALARGRPGAALLLVVTSLVPGAGADGPAVRAEGRTLVAPGERLETLTGSPEAIGPESPWIAVVWLPAGARMDRPLTVAWRGAEAEVVFRD